MAANDGASGVTAEVAENPAYWRSLCPGLSVMSRKNSMAASDEAADQDSSVSDECKARLLCDGYFTVSSVVNRPEPAFQRTLNAVADGIVALVAAGWPPTFIFVFDEPWELLEYAAKINAATSGTAPNMDFLAFLVDPNLSGGGFTPHRDRQPEDVASSFFDDGRPKYSTCWLALKDATPENSCLYFIPRDNDPGYSGGDGTGEDDDMLRDALCSKEAYQYIRAVPLRQGEAAFFSHRLIHWGSRGRQGYPHPRFALSFAFSDPDFEAPFFPTSHLPSPPLGLRLGLAAAQLFCYHERFEPTLGSLAIYDALFKAVASDFHMTYRAKVSKEYIIAVLEAEGRGSCVEDGSAEKKAIQCSQAKFIGGGGLQVAAGIRQGEDGFGASGDCGDLVDHALEMMLDAVHNGGADDFDDDFDNDCSDGDGGGACSSSSNSGSECEDIDITNQDPAADIKRQRLE